MVELLVTYLDMTVPPSGPVLASLDSAVCLAEAFQGRRLGPYLLDASLHAIWARKPERVWLHTDTNDHPKALSLYLRAGFAIRERRLEAFPD